VESETIQAIVQLELGFVAVVEALRDWTTAFPSAGGVRPSPPVTSTGLAVWQRSPRDAFGRLQTVRMPVAMMKSPGSPPVPSLESYDPPVPEPEPIEALRDWTTTFPSAGGVRPSPPVTSSGLAVWQRGPRDAFGRLQTY
jgi:hypothetical protein